MLEIKAGSRGFWRTFCYKLASCCDSIFSFLKNPNQQNKNAKTQLLRNPQQGQQVSIETQQIEGNLNQLTSSPQQQQNNSQEQTTPQEAQPVQINPNQESGSEIQQIQNDPESTTDPINHIKRTVIKKIKEPRDIFKRRSNKHLILQRKLKKLQQDLEESKQNGCEIKNSSKQEITTQNQDSKEDIIDSSQNNQNNINENHLSQISQQHQEEQTNQNDEQSNTQIGQQQKQQSKSDISANLNTAHLSGDGKAQIIDQGEQTKEILEKEKNVDYCLENKQDSQNEQRPQEDNKSGQEDHEKQDNDQKSLEKEAKSNLDKVQSQTSQSSKNENNKDSQATETKKYDGTQYSHDSSQNWLLQNKNKNEYYNNDQDQNQDNQQQIFFTFKTACYTRPIIRSQNSIPNSNEDDENKNRKKTSDSFFIQKKIQKSVPSRWASQKN